MEYILYNDLKIPVIVKATTCNFQMLKNGHLKRHFVLVTISTNRNPTDFFLSFVFQAFPCISTGIYGKTDLICHLLLTRFHLLLLL